MISWLSNRKCSPIGVDIGSRCVKLVQFSADHSTLLEAARWDIAPSEEGDKDTEAQLCQALKHAMEGRGFRGRDAVLCLGDQQLFLQNIRVAKTEGPELDRLIKQEAAGRIPFSVAEAEIRFIESADVRQGDATLREVILMACHRPVLERVLRIVQSAGLNPVAVEVEPCALLRSYTRQYRRDEDHHNRTMFVHVGYNKTMAVIAQGDDALFIKYIDVSGAQMDESVARHLEMAPTDAAALRRHNGDRRSEQQDPEVTRSIAEAVRPVIERLVNELSLCVRYHSVTFRGKPLSRLILGGGEATAQLTESLTRKLGLKCELGDPLRDFQRSPGSSRHGQWDIAAGLALRELQ